MKRANYVMGSLVSNSFDIKSLPLYRQIALIGGFLLFISLFFPWVRASADMGGGLGSVSGSASGWDGIGTLVGLLAIVLVAWEVIRVLGVSNQVKINPDILTAAIAALVALFGVIQFIRALSQSAPMPGISVGPHVGAFLILIFSIGLGYAAFLAFQAAGGSAALQDLNKAQAASADAAPAPTDNDVPPPAAPEDPNADDQRQAPSGS
ncbi:hypothetical protein [Phytoactinopolyspora mesophila]|uniref:Uncharacterized protein n=1 Tax=Phytoactinopolyspora mesophila TaxID=2650750 RepID=A0A7K3M6G2_9ACTN|nr:hypothetical protein [Phytoactinopolyspora mesophila]NDL58008.1 hypothetical protein [Phytoactinopolyspora mesophila]